MSKFLPNSFQIPNALIDDLIADISPNALKCYLVIVRKTVGWSKEWDFIPTTQLMEFTGIKKKQTVYSAIAELEELGLIEALKETGKTTKYRLKLVPEIVATKNGTSTENGNEVVPKMGTGTSTENGYPSKDTNKTQYTKEKINKKDFDIVAIENELAGRFLSSVTEMKYQLDADNYQDFIQYRKEIKKPITEMAAKQHIQLLCKYPRDIQAEIIKQSISNGWSGLFEPKQQKQFIQPTNKRENFNNLVNEVFADLEQQGETVFDVEVVE